jgi:cellulose synthase/poly-beta-1,6-N-acetylglucosamine synthase-like glycosyltransferase
VLLPVRNGDRFLGPALESLYRQTFSDFEIVAVDDGSTDGTLSLLREEARRDPRLVVLTQEPAGIARALEAARGRARGTYLARMDADDESEPERFQQQMDLMKSDRRVVACGTQVTYFPRPAVRKGAQRYEAWINRCISHDRMIRDLFIECPLPHPTFCLRADATRLVGGYRDRGWPEDYDLLLRLWEAGGRLAKVPRPLLRWRESPGRLSRTHAAYSPESFRRCKVAFLLRTHLARGRGAVIWGAGPVGKALARELKRQGGTVLAFVDLNPNKVGQEVHGAPVVPPSEVNRYRKGFSLAAVGQPGGRKQIRAALLEAGWVELQDFVAVA